MNTKAVTPTYEGAHCLYASRLDLIGQGSFMGKAPFKKDNPEIFEPYKIQGNLIPNFLEVQK